ncbi:pectinacetylesterase family protein (macronuclear) [Tetrahymena thermophila SB210]|uniref:Pectinacetylesterase family protein n=1 Tax=Tetrahymena thermophila (strain SB210) TaxID=312017 RepID=W7XG52_TETTS|nr:pectinacetylesterase family protein [Tetrahymena thermophila SB210]EWS73071.1 pectinacetylesterase family protein [Tetrahymena thermophila SB210]|eukprot:XP_012654380.1 pectinacetylesterase family protein [Tetrahymena thermophila SB210]
MLDEKQLFQIKHMSLGEIQDGHFQEYNQKIKLINSNDSSIVINKGQKKIFSIEIDKIVDQTPEIIDSCCNICLKICSQMFECSNCLTMYCYNCSILLQEASQNCFYCKNVLKLQNTIKNLQTLINESKYQCTYYLNGCREISTLNNLQTHENQCTYKTQVKIEEADLKKQEECPQQLKEQNKVKIIKKEIQKPTRIQPQRNKRKKNFFYDDY